MNSFDVFIEITPDTGPVKYERDEKSGLLRVDRFMATTMRYPCSYGFVPNTLGGDGDPLDALLYASHKVLAGSVISSRAIGVLLTEDEGGKDSKILALPIEKIDPMLSSVKSYKDMPDLFIKSIEHFFQHYKDLEKDKWVKILGWRDSSEADDIIAQAKENIKK